MGKLVCGQAGQLGVLQQKELGVRSQSSGGLKRGDPTEEVAAKELRRRVRGGVQVVEVSRASRWPEAPPPG